MIFKSSIFCMKLSPKCKGVLCVFGAVLFNASYGTSNTFGNMSPYIASYLRLRTSNTWVTTGYMMWIFVSIWIFQGVVMALGGIVEKNVGTRMACSISCVILSISVIMTYFTIQVNLWYVIITYGVLCGIGTGLSFSVTLGAALKWFPHHRGLVSGLVSCGYGAGSFFFTLIETKFINPLNVSPVLTNISRISLNGSVIAQEKHFYDAGVLNNIPFCFIMLGIIYTVLQVIGVICMMDYDGYELLDLATPVAVAKDISYFDTFLTNLDERSRLTSSSDYMNYSLRDDTSNQDLLRNEMFWLLLMTFFFSGFFFVIVMVQYKAFGQQFIDNDHYFAVLGSVSPIFGIIGRIILGRLHDRYNYRIVMSVSSFLMAFSIGLFYFCSLIRHPLIARIIYFVWVCLLFAIQSAPFILIPMGLVQCFGTKNFSVIFGLMYAGPTSASVIGAIASSILFYVLHYEGQFGIVAAASIMSLILTQFYKPPDRKE